MKLKKVNILPIIVTTVLILPIGVAMGAFLEKRYGFKNILQGNFQTDSSSETTQTNQTSIPQKYQGKLQLFILAGQSNMAGMGDLPPQTKLANTNPKIYVFGNDYRWKLAKEPIDDPTNQIDRISEDKPTGYSPALSFATAVLKQRPDMVIGLIPCAKGGSLIDEWQRKGNLDENTLYGSCLKRVRAASLMGNVAGILFFQGEIDAVDPKEEPKRVFSANQWANKFTLLIDNWRGDLNSPNLPVVYAQIGSNTEPQRFVNWAVVQQQQRQVKLPYSAMITTDDLALKDYVHFTTESYQIIGQRFAKAYLSLPK
ncbi:sialate O-acetylesterase [Floridanema evergladense]|uniref:Sialate O-acetylesterase n=1 Tax=Floridaenema evergladense BLCC-F167 TaxID=3153639 RepID=A0ABV4WQW1_9CYAN